VRVQASALRHLPKKFLQKSNGVYPKRACYNHKFHNINAALAPFVFGHKRLWFLEQVSDLLLGQPNLSTSRDQEFAKGTLCWRMNGFG
jgi:hypothetical protein